MRRLFAVAAICGAMWLVAGTAVAQSTDTSGASDGVRIRISPAAHELNLGETADLRIEVVNDGTAPTAPLLVHLDVTSPDGTGSVDPEDWTDTLSQPVGVLAPGESGVVDWQIQPISPGRFLLYVVALSDGADALSPSNVTTVDVVDRRSLNPDGILPVAIAVPGAVGALLIVRLRSMRPNRQP